MDDAILTENPQVAANDLVMAKEMADTLNQHYPGHLWAVHVDGAGSGFADVRNMGLSGAWGFRVMLKHTYSASEFRHRIVMAGGEILERYRLSRGKFCEEQYAALPTDRFGNFRADK